MLFKESVQIAITALLSNKLRSILTMLGIIIGVGAVIAMISIGMGVRQNVTDSIASLGSNMLIVTPGSTNQGGVRSAAGSSSTATRTGTRRSTASRRNTCRFATCPYRRARSSLRLTSTRATASPSSARPSPPTSSTPRTPSARTSASTASPIRSSASSKARASRLWAATRTTSSSSP